MPSTIPVHRENQEKKTSNPRTSSFQQKANMKGIIISAIAVLAMIQFMVEPGQALTCGQVDASLAPCIPYLTQGGDPSAACCIGVTALKGMAQNTADKRAACNCVKATANRYANLKEDAAQALPNKCGVTLDITVSKSVNCDMIN
ncbi:non-specific lipid-transfer protein 1-like [Nicotiana tomentosiformis]|uniref:non-specific lipid-transfer protein 1-like n=1 Tax=Nicotiana tomentosiformis TaxID=4098 RepID=UPI00388CD77F